MNRRTTTGTALLRLTLVTLFALSVLLLSGCAKFNPILGGSGATNKENGTESLFVPDDGNDTEIGDNGNDFNGDIVTPPEGGKSDSTVNSGDDSGGGRLY